MGFYFLPKTFFTSLTAVVCQKITAEGEVKKDATVRSGSHYVTLKSIVSPCLQVMCKLTAEKAC